MTSNMLYLGQWHPPFDKAWTPTLLSWSTEQLPLDESSLHEKIIQFFWLENSAVFM